MNLSREKLRHGGNSPHYFCFLSFLLYILSTSEKQIPQPWGAEGCIAPFPLSCPKVPHFLRSKLSPQGRNTSHPQGWACCFLTAEEIKYINPKDFCRESKRQEEGRSWRCYYLSGPQQSCAMSQHLPDCCCCIFYHSADGG